MRDLVNTLQKEMRIALSWVEQNEMIANPEKFHVIILRKSKANTCGEQMIRPGHNRAGAGGVIQNTRKIGCHIERPIMVFS